MVERVDLNASNDVIQLAFEPVPDAWEQVFGVRLNLMEGDDATVSLAVNPYSSYAGGAMTYQGWPTSLDLVFRAGPATESSSAVLRCALSEKPAWMQYPALIVLLLMTFSLAVGACASLAFVAQPPGRFVWALPLTVFASGAGLWLLITPHFEAPDEPHHYDYVRWVASHGKLPDAVPENPNEWETLDWYNDQWIQAPLYYLAMSPVVVAAGATTAGRCGLPARGRSGEAAARKGRSTSIPGRPVHSCRG